MSVQNPFEPGSTLYWKRETEREAERANEWEKEADKMVHHAFRHKDRADRAESERDEARQEAAQLRGVLQKARHYVSFHLDTDEDAAGVLDEIIAMQSVPPASEPDICPDGLLPDGETCPRCGGNRAPSGIGGGTWVHTTGPAPADTPASESDEGMGIDDALRLLDQLMYGDPSGHTRIENVPKLKEYVFNLRGDSPAVPDGYVLVPRKATDWQIIHGIYHSTVDWDAYEIEEVEDKAAICGCVYRAMIAAAPTPTDGEK